MTIKTMCGAQFKDELGKLAAQLNDDDQVFFGSGDLSFGRIKERSPTTGPRIFNIEFIELYKITEDWEEPKI